MKIKTTLAAILLLTTSAALATEPQQTTVLDPSATANQQQGQVGIVKGGDTNITTNPFITVGGAAAEANGELSIGQVSPTSKVGDTLATGTVGLSGSGNSSSSSSSSSNSSTKLSNVGSPIITTTHEAPDLSKRVPNVILSALVANGCIGSGNGGFSVPGLGVGVGKTVEHKRCTRLLYAAAVDSYGTSSHRALSFEITCGDSVVADADLLMGVNLCQKNKTATSSNVTIPAYVSKPVTIQKIAWWARSSRK